MISNGYQVRLPEKMAIGIGNFVGSADVGFRTCAIPGLALAL
jgi:hypothetical protein